MAKPRPVSPSPNHPTPSRWSTYVIAGLVGAIIGSGTTLLILKPQLDRARNVSAGSAVLPAPASAAAAAIAGTTALPVPPANLTAGLTPAEADRTLGNFHYDRRNWADAQRHYEAAIRQGSDDADIRTDLGNVYRFSGRPAEALAQYELAQRMNPQHEFSLFNQGGLFLEEMHDPVRAIAAWESYLARFPNGRNVMAARQLIAQARGTPPPTAVGPFQSGTMPGAPTQPTANPTDQRLLDLVKKAPGKP